MRKVKQAQPAQNEIVEAVKALAHEKGISEEMLFTTIEDALKAAFKKNLGKDEQMPANLSVTLDRTTGVTHAYARKLIVEEVEESSSQISYEDAVKLNPSYQMGDIAEIDVTPTGFLRVAAQTAKQVIIQRLRAAERGRVYDEYIEKENEILTAVVKRIEPYGAYVDLGRTEGLLETSEMIPHESLEEGDHIKVYVLEVQKSDSMALRGPQVRVSRIHPNLVKRLFEMEVPEIASGVVTIKSIAREAGSRTKMAVYSADMMIDPVGACVGPRGNRVERVVAELKGEKVDVVSWSQDPAAFIGQALQPATILSVFVSENNEKSCRAIVPDNQLSLAIGKEGQNARLAAKLTGWKIDIKSESQAQELTDMVDNITVAPEDYMGKYDTVEDIDRSQAPEIDENAEDDTL